jgi:hypothetical protein
MEGKCTVIKTDHDCTLQCIDEASDCEILDGNSSLSEFEEDVNDIYKSNINQSTIHQSTDQSIYDSSETSSSEFEDDPNFQQEIAAFSRSETLTDKDGSIWCYKSTPRAKTKS